MRVEKSLALLGLAILVLGCATPPERLSFPAEAFPAVLTVAGRGNVPVIIEIGGVEVARVPCAIGAVVTPGEGVTPPLPWDLRVVSQVDGRVLLADRVTELPKWLLVIGDQAGLGSTPASGPPGPSCAPA